MGLACLWGVVAVPALVYPPLPPGVEPSLPIGERQALYLATIAAGVLGFAGAVHALGTRQRFRVPLAAAFVAGLAGLAWFLFPDPDPDLGAVSRGLLAEFRSVAIASQVVFWGALTLTGALLLRPPGRGAWQ
jgi:predicted cobalt transporter CbtA